MFVPAVRPEHRGHREVKDGHPDRFRHDADDVHDDEDQAPGPGLDTAATGTPAPAASAAAPVASAGVTR